jgi:hypothetical protein
MVRWIKANRELIAQRLRSVMRGIAGAIKAVGVGLDLVWRALNFVIARWKLFAALIVGSLAAIAIANAGAVFSFIALGAAAIGSAIAAAAAWVVAAAPFIALAALIAIVLLALEDLWVFLHGGKSLIGDVGKELAKLVSDFIDQGPKAGEHWMLKILRSVLIYLRAVGRAWEFIFGKIFDGVSWMATKIDGLITRLDMLARIANVKWDITGNLKRGGKTVLGALDSAGVAVGNAAEGASQLFAPRAPMVSSAPQVAQSKVVNASYAPTIVQQPGQSGTEVAGESQRLFTEWMSSQVESASAAVGAK